MAERQYLGAHLDGHADQGWIIDKVSGLGGVGLHVEKRLSVLLEEPVARPFAEQVEAVLANGGPGE